MSGEVRGDAEQALNYHQMAAVTHFVFLGCDQHFEARFHAWLETSGLGLEVLVFDGMAIGQHALVQNAGDEDTVAVAAIKQDVRTVLVASQAGTNVITGTTQLRIGSQLLAAQLQIVEVTGSLGLAPGSQGVLGDAQ